MAATTGTVLVYESAQVAAGWLGKQKPLSQVLERQRHGKGGCAFTMAEGSPINGAE